MKLNLEAEFKSLTPFTVELPPLTILTGVNGAGKTHILLAISEGQLQVTENDIELNNPKYVTNQTLSPNDSEAITKQILTQKTEGLWNEYNSSLQSYNMNKYYRQNSISIERYFSDTVRRKDFENVAKATGKQIHELNLNDFFENDLLADAFATNDIFHQNFSILFKRYYDKFDNNRYNRLRYSETGVKESEFVSDEEFVQIYGESPWDLSNKIIEEANLDYRFNSPVGMHRDAPFELKLINNFNGAEVKFSDLSSGEKVLMSLALAFYNSKFDIEFPKLLLMDEPDASLHPSMAKQFLDVIQKVFVQDKGVRVIITTHSPSTVALAPEEAIFVVNKTGERIKKASKDAALKILTAGVPSFSVNYENRRQVFVESENDVYFYEKIYGKLSDYLEPEISLSFISSGESATDKNQQKIANCEQVKNITNILRSAGNKFIFGIVDWDTTNTNTEYVKVLGEGNRYSIENYIFDPIFISALLLREKVITREDLGLTNNENYSDFKSLLEEQLQIIANFVTDKIATQVLPIDNTKKTVKFLKGNEIEVPTWYLHLQGHQLETQLKETFPQLNRFNKEDALKKEVINKIIDDIPELVSNDILEVFRQIQTID